mmetsp:Transcript_11735/g.27250  ORF Transcript_11735/g.27250 Transcript_11735/m.27250 type:complete len:238 (-) Transcript_11735:823-1536(-)
MSNVPRYSRHRRPGRRDDVPGSLHELNVLRPPAVGELVGRREGEPLPLQGHGVLEGVEGVALGGPGGLVAHCLPEEDAKGPHVDPVGEVLALELLRCHVRGAPADGRSGEGGPLDLARAPEVGHLCGEVAVVEAEEDVAAVEVAVDDALGVNVAHPSPHVEQDAHLLLVVQLVAQPVLVQRAVQRALLAELEHHANVRLVGRLRVRGEVGGRAPEGHDVGVPDAYEDRELQEKLPHL